MGYYQTFNNVFQQVKSTLEDISSLKQVVLGEQFRLANLPLAIINPASSVFSQGEIGDMLENTLEFEVLVLIRETEPENWFTNIISPMCDVVDAVLADRTLNGTAKDCMPTSFEPGEIRMANRLYYGGLIRFKALLFYTPS
jgi:hypothetical protein